MLLHIYVQKINFESPPSDAMASFLSIHSGSFEYCISSVYYKNGTAVFDQVVHVPIPNDNDTVTKVTLIGSIFLKNGNFEPQGKCSFITSPIEHGATKRLSLFGKGGSIMSEVELTASFYATPMDAGSRLGINGPEGQITDEFRKEYEFLMSRKKNWGSHRPATWIGEQEALLGGADARDYDEDNERNHARQTGEKEYGQRHRPIRSSWESPPKLRKTCMAVGYVNFWPSLKDAQCNEDKIMFKLHLAEQRRLKLLRDTEERARARNLMDKKASEAALNKKPQGDITKLKKMLTEKERELRLLRSNVASQAATLHKDFNRYHHTHSAVESNITTAILGPNRNSRKETAGGRDGQTSIPVKKHPVPKQKARTAKKASSANKKKVQSIRDAERPQSTSKTAVSKKKTSRIKTRREEQVGTEKLSKAAKSGSSNGAGSAKMMKRILNKSQILQQRLNHSYNSNEDIHLKLSRLQNLSDNSSSEEDEDLAAGDTSGDEINLLNGSMSALRQSFREALDLTAKKSKDLGTADAKIYTRTVFIPTSSTLRMDLAGHETELGNISCIDSAPEQRCIDAVKDRNGHQNRGKDRDDFEAAHTADNVTKSTFGQPRSVYEELLLAMATTPQSSDSDSVNLTDYEQFLSSSIRGDAAASSTRKRRAVSNGRRKVETATCKKEETNTVTPLDQLSTRSMGSTCVTTKSTTTRSRQSVTHASTASSRQRVNSSSVQSSSRAKQTKKIPSKRTAEGKTSSSDENVDIEAIRAAAMSSYLQLLSSNSKDFSDEARFNHLLHAANDGFDFESTMARLLATTPLLTSKVQATSSQYNENDFNDCFEFVQQSSLGSPLARSHEPNDSSCIDAESQTVDIHENKVVDVAASLMNETTTTVADRKISDGFEEMLDVVVDMKQAQTLTCNPEEIRQEVNGSPAVFHEDGAIEEVEEEEEGSILQPAISAAQFTSSVPGSAAVDYNSQINGVGTTVHALEVLLPVMKNISSTSDKLAC